MDINALLNPVSPESTYARNTRRLTNNRPSPTTPTNPPKVKRDPASRGTPSRMPSGNITAPRVPKDQPVFKKQPTNGPVNYPVYDVSADKTLKHAIRGFNINPAENIAQYCNRVPYSTTKRGFLERTGRSALEVFCYQYTYNGQPWTVMWDYNIGLVKTTAFYKSLKYPKVQPNKLKKINPTVDQIMHNITGGAIYAQGYWMPFEAARALAANFCHEIRYALVPIFGPSFPSMCAMPGQPDYKSFVIPLDIIDSCIRKQAEWVRDASRRNTPAPSSSMTLQPSPGHGLIPAIQNPAPPNTPIYHVPQTRSGLQLQLKAPQWHAASESGYGTDSSLGYGRPASQYSPSVSPKTLDGSDSFSIPHSVMVTPSLRAPPFPRPTFTPITTQWNPVNRTPKEMSAAQALIELATPTPSPIDEHPPRLAQFDASFLESRILPSPVHTCGSRKRHLEDETCQQGHKVLLSPIAKVGEAPGQLPSLIVKFAHPAGAQRPIKRARRHSD